MKGGSSGLCDGRAGAGAVGGGLYREGAQACITVQQKFLEKQLYSPKFIFYKKKKTQWISNLNSILLNS